MHKRSLVSATGMTVQCQERVVVTVTKPEESKQLLGFRRQLLGSGGWVGVLKRGAIGAAGDRRANEYRYLRVEA